VRRFYAIHLEALSLFFSFSSSKKSVKHRHTHGTAPALSPAGAVDTRTAERDAQIPTLVPLLKYQRLFEEHRARAEAVQRVVERRSAACKRAQAEISAQGAAAAAATAVLTEDMRKVALAFEAQRGPLAQQRKTQDELLATFQDSLAAMRATTLHRAISEWLVANNSGLAGAKTRALALIDLVPEERLISWAADCRAKHNDMVARVDAMHGDMDLLLADVEAFRKQQQSEETGVLAVQSAADDPRALLEKIIHDEQEVASLLRDFSADCANVARSVEAARMQTAAQPAWGLVDTYAEVQKAHDINLSLLDQLESNTAFTLKQFSSLKGRVTKRVVENLRRLSELETRIQAMYKTMTTLSQMSKSMHEAFKQLVCARLMPTAYREYEREIARRTAFGVSVSEQIARCVEQLRAMCDSERALRDEFRKQYVRYLPKELQAGTASQPPLFDFVLPPFDTDIPKITDAPLIAPTPVAATTALASAAAVPAPMMS